MVNLGSLLDEFAARVNHASPDVRIARVPSAGGACERVLVAPADRFKDGLPEAQRARQRDAGAMPPEVYGEDLFELLKDGTARLWDGRRVPLPDEQTARALLARFLVWSTAEGRRLARTSEKIREGMNAGRSAAREVVRSI